MLLKFQEKIRTLINWCQYSKVDINWEKTYAMIITNKRLVKPKSIKLCDVNIEVVDKFKLLGVTLDSKLSFKPFSANLKKLVSAKLYSINRLFYLSFSVKLQFFKSFINPYFDYCLSLAIYFPKEIIQRICNFYDFCLYKLLKINISSNELDNLNLFNNRLESLGLKNFEHRVLNKLATFVHKIVNEKNSPILLKQMIKRNNVYNSNRMNLRNNNEIRQAIQLYNHYGESTFIYFFSNFINALILNDLSCNFKFFCQRMSNNINLLYIKFKEKFPKFNLNHKTFKT